MIQKPLTAHEKRQYLAAYVRHLGYDPSEVVVKKIGLFTYGYRILPLIGDSMGAHIIKYKRWRGIDGIKIFIYRKRNRL